jgi:hypothetical protein
MTLPALRESVRVITSQNAPPKITKALARFDPDEDILEREAERYKAIKNPSAQEKAVMAAHQALAQDRVLVDTAATIKAHTQGGDWPRITVGHLTDKFVWCRMFRNGTYELRNGRRGGSVFHEYFGGTPYSRKEHEWYQRRADVPKLPPELERTVDKSRSDLLLLWEPEWVAEEHAPIPRPVLDPALLEHVSGSLYAVLAVWDLSAIEAAALGQRIG